MLWFVLANEFSTKKSLPKCFISFALSIERLISWKYFKRSLNLNDVDFEMNNAFLSTPLSEWIQTKINDNTTCSLTLTAVF